MTRSLVLTLILLTSAALANAISDSAGTKNGDFLKIPDDARAIVLGPNTVSMADSTEALYWNPSALGRTETQEFSFTHIQYYQNVTIDNMAYAYPLDENSAVAGSLFYLNSGSLEGRDTNGNPTGDFQLYDAVGSVGYGRLLHSREEGGPDLYLGGSFKVVREVIDDSGFTNPAVDVGLLAVPIDNMRAGVSVRNISTSKADFAKEYMGGVSYTFMRVFTPAIALNYAEDAPVRFSVAGEYLFPELENSALRVGYQTHDPLDDSTDAKIPAFRGASLAGLTMGAGLEYHPAAFKTLFFQLDYAMAPFGALGISHTLTLKLKW